jgi:hypothetical protein
VLVKPKTFVISEYATTELVFVNAIGTTRDLAVKIKKPVSTSHSPNVVATESAMKAVAPAAVIHHIMASCVSRLTDAMKWMVRARMVESAIELPVIVIALLMIWQYMAWRVRKD